MGFVYKLTNKTNGKFYIGATALPLAEIKLNRFNNQTTKYIFFNGQQNVSLEILEETDNLIEQRDKWRKRYNQGHTTKQTNNLKKEKTYKRLT